MFEIKPVREHFEVYLDGHFLCSADTESEAEREIKDYTERQNNYVQMAITNNG